MVGKHFYLIVSSYCGRDAETGHEPNKFANDRIRQKQNELAT